MKLVRIFTGPDEESHIEALEPDYSEGDSARTGDAGSHGCLLRAAPRGLVSSTSIQRLAGSTCCT